MGGTTFISPPQSTVVLSEPSHYLILGCCHRDASHVPSSSNSPGLAFFALTHPGSRLPTVSSQAPCIWPTFSWLMPFLLTTPEGGLELDKQFPLPVSFLTEEKCAILEANCTPETSTVLLACTALSLCLH